MCMRNQYVVQDQLTVYYRPYCTIFTSLYLIYCISIIRVYFSRDNKVIQSSLPTRSKTLLNRLHTIAISKYKKMRYLVITDRCFAKFSCV